MVRWRVLPKGRYALALAAAVLIHAGLAAIGVVVVGRTQASERAHPPASTVALVFTVQDAPADIGDDEPLEVVEARESATPTTAGRERLPTREDAAKARLRRAPQRREAPSEPVGAPPAPPAPAGSRSDDGAPWRPSPTDAEVDADLSRIDLYARARALPPYETPPSTKERVDGMVLGLRQEDGANALRGLVILERGEQETWVGRLAGSQLDGRRLAEGDPGVRPFVLERQEDGSLLYRGSGYRAVIAPDGSVRFLSERVVTPGIGPLVGDGRGAPGRGRGGGALEEGAMRDPLEGDMLPWLSGIFDLDRGLRALRNEDTLAADKAAFLERTRALREQMRAR